MKFKFILTFLTLASALSIKAQVTVAEKQALQDLYNATNGPGWATETDGFIGDEWDFNGAVTSDWYGVTVQNGHVVELDLEFNELAGTIPTSIGDLVHLALLNLSTNALTGTIPAEIGNLTELLTLDLGNNDLSGSLPIELGNLVNLLNLYLDRNEFIGTIPLELGNLLGLENLGLYGNTLSGPIPPELGNLSSLTYLGLLNNNLNGAIPPELGNLTNLTHLYLFYNDLSGAIPPELGNLSNLIYLNLSSNNLDGAIPGELGNLMNLWHLSLNANNLSGSIPLELGNLDNLVLLYLNSNELNNAIPQELGNLTNLQYLTLHFNDLTGNIPIELGDLTNLRYLTLSSNQLTGPIPVELTDLSNLQQLQLHHNGLSGTIPPELGNMSNLTHLYLYANALSGSIPPGLGNLSSLTYLGLHHNNLNGAIPQELGNLTALTQLHLYNNNLNGSIPPQIIDQTPIISFLVTNNRFDFGHLEYAYLNFNGNTFNYNPQQKTDQPEALQVNEGEDIILNTAISGSQNHYVWYKDGQPINGAPDAPDYNIVGATLQDAGIYHCVMTSDIVNGLTLTRHDIELSVINNPGELSEENWNIITVWDYDMDTNLKANTRRYYNELGKHVQTQSWDAITKAIWGQVTLYDYQGRPALSSLSAPIPGHTQFQYHPSFITDDEGGEYNAQDFDHDPFAPDSVLDDSPLGQYYSGITSDQYQDVTSYPFTRTVFSELNPDTPLAVVGGNKVDTDGKNGITEADKWPQAYSFTMPATDELSLDVAFDDMAYKSIQTLKTVTRDVHGNENVVFVDTDGKLLATARSGTDGVVSPQMSVRIGAQGWVDVHIPEGVNTGISMSDQGGVTVYNLITDAVEPTAMNSLPPGFYRVAVNDLENYVPNSLSVQYRVNYYDYSLNEYDEVNRLVASYQPVTDGNGNKLVTTYTYNTLGQLVSTTSPDEGTANFKYRNDGQIRYSQNSEQALVSEVSYTDYDTFARPVESGVLLNVNFANLHPDAPLPQANTKETVATTYDFLDDADNTFLNNLDPDYQHPSFLAGNVAKTTNDQSTTYYSYDGYGRVQWLVQDITGLGTKTMDYAYEPLTGLVQKVIYQKGAEDQFVHRYGYNDRDQLVQVETSVDDNAFVLQAEYIYNDAGTLVRTELADGAQGLDYVYTLAGQLKSINHPSLSPNDDPSGDTNDLFGMQLDYHLGDYQRSENSNITTAPQGTDQFNGNIKGVRWQTATQGAQESQYVYSYDRNNWLTGADFAPGENNGNAYDVETLAYDANGNLQSLVRNKDLNEEDDTSMDNLTYNYDPNRPNRLLWVDDAAGDVLDADDIGDQNANNYTYNAIGQLTHDNSQQIGYIYNASGLVTEVQRNVKPLVKFFYNDRNHRIRKETYENGVLMATTYYVRDVSGSVMAIYSDISGEMELAEQPIYGAGRIGVAYTANNSKTYVYELTDHLGNVRAVFTKNNNDATLEGNTDYYPGGMAMPGRNIVGDYRYDYQGQELDKETGKIAFELRLYDPRINRWLTTDPYRQYASPYLAMGNNWISRVDPDGGFDWKKDKNGNVVYDSNLTAENADFMLGEGETYLGETHFEDNIFYHSNGLINNFDTGEFFQAFDHGLSEVVVGPGATVQRSSIQGYDYMLAIETLNANAFPSYNEECGRCAKKVRLALEAGGLNTSDRAWQKSHPQTTNSAKNYIYYLPKKGFSEVPQENYVPQAGDIAVIQSYTGGSVHGHIQMYNGEEWVSDFVQNDFWPGSGYNKNQPQFNVFR